MLNWSILFDIQKKLSTVYSKTKTDELLNAKANTVDVNTELDEKVNIADVTTVLDSSTNPVSNKAVKDSMTKIFNGTHTTGSLAGNNDYTITIPLPTGWTKITGISAIIYPKASWNTVGYLSVPAYQSDGTVTFGIHTIGTTAQAYVISYTALGN